MSDSLFRVSPTKIAISLELLAGAALEAQYQSTRMITSKTPKAAYVADIVSYLCLHRLRLLARPLLIDGTAGILRPSRSRHSDVIKPFTAKIRGWKREYKNLSFKG